MVQNMDFTKNGVLLVCHNISIQMGVRIFAMYRGELLAGYAGEIVVLRCDPRDITTILVYHREGATVRMSKLCSKVQGSGVMG
jgi:hypothetical protein